MCELCEGRYSVRLIGGPRDGEMHVVDIPAIRMLFPGPVEERVLVGWDDGPRYAYPTDVYAQDLSYGLNPGVTTYAYAGRRPPT